MKAIIFDLDGTIVFSHPTHFAAYEELFGEFGIKWNYEEFNNVFAGTGAPVIIKNLLTRHGITDFDLAVLVKKKRDIFNRILENNKLKTVPGFFEFLKILNERGIKKIIASGSNRENIKHMLINIGAESEFPLYISGEDVKNPKPAPDIFLAAAEKIGVTPRQCAVIEDTTHGVIGAKAAHMKAIALTTTCDRNVLASAGADMIVENYLKLRI